MNPRPCRSIRHLRWAHAVAVLALFCTTRAIASSLTISNFSFENATGYWQADASPSSWVTDFGSQVGGFSFNQQVLGGAGAGLSGFDGNNVLSLNLDPGGAPGSGTQWLHSVSLGLYESNTLYTLTVGVAKVNANETRSAILALTAGALGSGAASLTSTVASTSINATNLSSAFQDFTVVLDTSANTAMVGQKIGILLEHGTVNGQYGRELYFDNVRLEMMAIPETSTLALLLLVAPAWLLARRHTA